MNLFQKKETKLNSGQVSDFKINCDALTDADWECLAYLISKQIKFRTVEGVPSGGIKLQNALRKYEISDIKYPILLCDDVLTTGSSLNKLRGKLLEYGTIPIDEFVGYVVFARGEQPDWIKSLFPLSDGKS